jgi:hypothetical protein
MSKNLFVVLISIFFISGCATAPIIDPKYDFGNYSHALYQYKKNHTDVTYQEYKKALNDVIERTKTSGYRVPPGIYCEYGFLLVQEGKPEEANTYFELEKKTYPESTVLIERLIKEINKKGGAI